MNLEPSFNYFDEQMFFSMAALRCAVPLAPAGMLHPRNGAEVARIVRETLECLLPWSHTRRRGLTNPASIIEKAMMDATGGSPSSRSHVFSAYREAEYFVRLV